MDSKRRKRERKERRVYLRFTERDYCLLQRLTILDGKCIADLLEGIIDAAARERVRVDWGLAQWWADEKFRISLEETGVP